MAATAFTDRSDRREKACKKEESIYALYETMKREDLNWLKFHEQVAHKTVQTFKASGKKAYVVDDSIRQRFGKKMPGISSHFDPYQRTA
jgi:hypothetical protein